MSKRIALFAGSFDPYTNGHHAIVRKAAALFDVVVVMIAVNIEKRRAFDAEAMRRAIQKALDADGLNARAVVCGGLVADYCAENGIRWYVRGLRNSADYSYEENTARVNARLNPGLETIYLRELVALDLRACRADDDAISSSVVRELMAFKHDVSEFVPGPVYDALEMRRCNP